MIHAQVQQQGVEIERMYRLAGASRAGYYRYWQAWAPWQEETAVRNEIRRLSLANRHHGYRVITVLLQRAGWAVNHKRVQQLRRVDNLLCVARQAFRPATTDSRHGWRVWSNLARHMVPMVVNRLWVADITYIMITQQSGSKAKRPNSFRHGGRRPVIHDLLVWPQEFVDGRPSPAMTVCNVSPYFPTAE